MYKNDYLRMYNFDHINACLLGKDMVFNVPNDQVVEVFLLPSLTFS